MMVSSPRVLLVFRYYVSSFVYLPSILAKANLKVDVVADRTHLVRHAKAVDRFYFVPADTDEAFWQTTIERLETGEYVFLLVTDEPGRNIFVRDPLPASLQHYASLPQNNALSQAVLDKILFQQWCEKNSIPVAPGRMVATAEEAVAYATTLDYPVVVKGAEGTGGQAVQFCHHADEVETAFTRFATNDRVMVQQFIRGPVGAVSFVAHRGKVAAWFAFEKTVALLQGKGPAVVPTLRCDEELKAITHRLAAAGEVSGITGFDWMETAPGRFVVIDPHFGRCTPQLAIADRAGVDYAKAIRQIIEGKIVLQDPDPARCGSVVMYPQVVELIFQGEFLKLLSMVLPFNKNTSYYFGPRTEFELSLQIAKKYTHDHFRVVFGRWRRSLF